VLIYSSDVSTTQKVKKTFDLSAPANQTATIKTVSYMSSSTHITRRAASAPTAVQATCDMHSLNQVISCVQQSHVIDILA
jgi:hypothetical protein